MDFDDAFDLVAGGCAPTGGEKSNDRDGAPAYVWIIGLILVAAAVGFVLVHLVRTI